MTGQDLGSLTFRTTRSWTTALRLARITHERKPLREPLAVVWDKRRELPRHVRDFCETLAAHMRELSSVTRQPVPKLDRSNKRRSPTRTKVR